MNRNTKITTTKPSTTSTTTKPSTTPTTKTSSTSKEKKPKPPLEITPEHMFKKSPFQCYFCSWYNVNVISHYKSRHKTTCTIQCLECKKKPVFESDEQYMEHLKKRNHIWNDAQVNSVHFNASQNSEI